MRRLVCLLILVLARSATLPSIQEMSPPIRGLTLAALRDTFDEIHNGNPHEAIDIMAPKGTPVLAVVSGVIRKLFLSKPGGITIYQPKSSSLKSG